MRGLVLLVALAGMAGAQSLAEYGAAAAGGATGGAAGKKVSDGITAIFGKVDKQASDAAKQGAAKPGVTEAKPVEAKPAARETKSDQTATPATEAAVVSAPARRAPVVADPDQVPPPPGEKRPVRHVAKKPAETSLMAAVPVPLLSEISAPVLPAPPMATPEALRTIARGATRADVLSLGFPSSRINMYDDGHFTEIFGYIHDDVTFAVVRLSDGVVSSVELH